MAKRDIAGLLTGIPSGGIDPRVGMTGRQMLVQSALAGQERMAGGLRGMFGGQPTIQQQIATAAIQKQREDEAKKEVEGITVTLADISFEALDVAKSNGESLEVDVHYIQSDWFSNIDQVFDVIVCNPPYIPDDELIGDTVDKEPNLALFGGKTGLEHYETVIAQSKTFLQSNGLMAFEHGYNQKEALHQIILTHYENASIVTLKDFEDKDRMTFFSPNNKKLMKEGLR